jgi:hypothetical protein
MALSDTRKKNQQTHHDVWSRFERAVDVVAKSPPQHKTKKDQSKKKKEKPSPDKRS